MRIWQWVFEWVYNGRKLSRKGKNTTKAIFQSSIFLALYTGVCVMPRGSNQKHHRVMCWESARLLSSIRGWDAKQMPRSSSGTGAANWAQQQFVLICNRRSESISEDFPRGAQKRSWGTWSGDKKTELSLAKLEPDRESLVATTPQRWDRSH